MLQMVPHDQSMWVDSVIWGNILDNFFKYIWILLFIEFS